MVPLKIGRYGNHECLVWSQQPVNNKKCAQFLAFLTAVKMWRLICYLGGKTNNIFLVCTTGYSLDHPLLLQCIPSLRPSSSSIEIK